MRKRGERMRSMRFGIVCVTLVLLTWVSGSLDSASAQNAQAVGYAVKKPVFGGSGPAGPWGGMGDIVKAAMKLYGWDIQMCYSCAGGPRAARLVAGAVVPPQPPNPNPNNATPRGPVDFGATSTEFLQWAYLGVHDFAKDPEGARKNLRVVANIQTPTYYVLAVKADSGITDLRQIVERRMPVTVLKRGGIGDQLQAAILDYYGLTDERVKSFGGTITETYTRGMKVDVILAFAG